jgi:hypothetical protein
MGRGGGVATNAGRNLHGGLRDNRDIRSGEPVTGDGTQQVNEDHTVPNSPSLERDPQPNPRMNTAPQQRRFAQLFLAGYAQRSAQST